MNRQYVGARYVPKFFNNNGSNEWVSGIAYEPLTIVTYLNSSYTSVKPVPSNAGSPNTATEYWSCTGNYVEIISDVTSRVGTLEDEYTTLNNDYTAFKPLAMNYCVSPEMYGGVGDGVADDTEALKACIGSNRVVVLKGTYKTTSVIRVDIGNA